jgi:hypothetical protein
MMRSLKKTLPLLLVSLLLRLLATFCNCIYYSDTRLVPPTGTLGGVARSLRGGPYADR